MITPLILFVAMVILLTFLVIAKWVSESEYFVLSFVKAVEKIEREKILCLTNFNQVNNTIMLLSTVIVFVRAPIRV